MGYLLKAGIVKPIDIAVAGEWLCKQQLLLGRGSVLITWSRPTDMNAAVE
jgi:hypothetical protein